MPNVSGAFQPKPRGVAVPVERGLDRGMAQLRLDVLRVAVGDQQAGIRVAEVVKPDAAELGPPERSWGVCGGA